VSSIPQQTPPHDPWEDCTFEGAELFNLRRGAQMTFAEKIKWLEEGHKIAIAFERTRLAAEKTSNEAKTK
jgi:hypothetical protein